MPAARYTTTPTPATLQDPERFVCVERLAHADVAAAIRPHLRRGSVVTASYWLLNAVALGWLVIAWQRAAIGLVAGFPTVCLGMTGGYVLLLPLHEGIHALAYRAVGARHATVHYAWRRVTAHCVAGHEVPGRTAFAVVCLAPLVVLNGALLAVAAVVPPERSWALGVAGALLLHTGAASGDAALVDLLWRERHASALWTYDDVASGESYCFRPVDRASTAGA